MKNRSEKLPCGRERKLNGEGHWGAWVLLAMAVIILSERHFLDCGANLQQGGESNNRRQCSNFGLKLIIITSWKL